MEKRANFITISELSNLTGVNIKSLRYYEQLGVLKPAYVNPKSHYRYYTCSQIPIVDLIQFYVETDIPLSELQQYTNADTGSIRLRDPLFFVLATAQQKLKKLQATVEQAETLLEEIDRSDELLYSDQLISRELPTQICYTLQIYGELTETLYYASLRHMLMDMQQNNVPLGYETGVLSFKADDKRQTYVYATVSISQKDITDDTHFIKIPAQAFLCRKGDFSMVEQPEMAKYFGEANIPELWILSELYSSEFDCNHPVFELRWGG
jgi:DNA-binding transcriptional MerR regulator